MAGFLFRLETLNGTPAEPPSLHSAVPNWRPGDTIPFGNKTLRVVGVRDDDPGQPPVLVVEDLGQMSHERRNLRFRNFAGAGSWEAPVAFGSPPPPRNHRDISNFFPRRTAVRSC